MWGIGLGGRVGGGHWKHFVNSPNVSIWCTKFVTLAHPPNPNPTTRTHTTTNTLIVHVPTHLPTNLGGCSTAFCITNVHHKMLHYAQIKHSPKNITQKQKKIDILEFKYTISFSLWLWFFCHEFLFCVINKLISNFFLDYVNRDQMQDDKSTMLETQLFFITYLGSQIVIRITSLLLSLTLIPFLCLMGL